MQRLQIEIPESLVPLPSRTTSRSTSSPPSSWVNHSPARCLPVLPSPVSPPHVQPGFSPIHLECDAYAEQREMTPPPTRPLPPPSPPLPFRPLLSPSTSPSSSPILPPGGPSPPTHYVEVEAPSPSVASLVEFVGNRASRTDLMGVVIDSSTPVFSSLAARPARSQQQTSLRPVPPTVPSHSGSPITTPPSAAALSSSITHTLDVSSMESRLPQVPARADPPVKASTRPSLHEMFYIRDEMVVLSVEDCLYRVHRHLLEHNSDFFRRLFFEGARDGRSLGTTDESAIALSEVSQHDFDCLLHFLYYRVFDDDALSLRDWITLLDVSTRLRFPKLRSRAIKEISTRRGSLTAVETIVLAHRHDVPGWLARAYGDLCRRQHPLDDSEAEQLGAKITARIARARETIRDETYRAIHQTKYESRFSYPEAYDEELVSKTVMEVFWLREA